MSRVYPAVWDPTAAAGVSYADPPIVPAEIRARVNARLTNLATFLESRDDHQHDAPPRASITDAPAAPADVLRLVREAFAALPRTPDAITSMLRTAKITGERHSRRTNPLTRYFTRAAASGAVVPAANIEADRALVTIRTVDGHVHYLLLPSAAYDFLTAFDAGAYPDLEARAVA
jgi:hypothetical protein